MSRVSPGLLSFNTGEVSPRLDGRVDLDKYASALRTMHNFVPSVQGPAIKRSGLRFVNEIRRPRDVTMFVDGFNVSTGGAGTTQVRTGYGATPKAIIVFSTGRSGAVTAAGRQSFMTAFGFASGPSARFAAMAYSNDAEPLTDTERIHRTDCVFVTRFGGSTDGRLDVQSFDADGVTFIVDEQFSAAWRITVLAIMGRDVQAEVSSFSLRDEIGEQEAAVSTFLPDTALLASINSSSGTSTTAYMSIGCASGPNGAIQNRVSSIMDQNAVTTTNTGSYSIDGEAYATLATTAPVLNGRSVVTEWRSNGFVIDARKVITGSPTTRGVGTLCLKGVQFTLGDLLTLTSTGVDINITGLPETVRGGLFVSTCLPENVMDVRQDGAAMSIGAFTGVGAQQAQGMASQHGQADSVVGASFDTANVYSNMAANAASVEGAMAVTAVGSGTVTLQMTDADPTQNFVWYLIGGPSEEPTQAALLPFKFNSTDNYVLEMGGQYVRFYRDGGVVTETSLTITSTTNATPVVVTTSDSHGFVDGDDILLDGTGIPALDDQVWRVNALTATTFELDGSTAPGSTSSTGSVARIYEISSPYASEDVDRLAYAQSADVLYLAHPSYPPHKLSRMGHTDWTLEELVPDHFPFAPENQDEQSFVAASESTGSITLTSSEGIFDATMVGSRFKLREIPEANQPEWMANTNFDAAGYRAFQANGATFEAGDRCQFEGRVYERADTSATTNTGSTAPVQDAGFSSDGQFDWKFINFGYGYALITAFTDQFRVSATVEEPFPRSNVSADVAVSSMSTANPIVVTTGANHNWETSDQVLFRDITGTFGDLVNNTLQTITRLTATTFSIPLDGAGLAGGVGSALRMNCGPNLNGNSQIFPSYWRWSFGAWSADRGYPTSVAIFENRLGFGGTEDDPQTLWLSRSGYFEDFRTTQDDDSAIVATLNAEDRIEWMAASEYLQIGTGGSEFTTTTSATDEPLVPGNVATRIIRQSSYGCRAVRPARVEQVVLFAQRAGLKLRELTPERGVPAPDMTVLAAHITQGIIRQLEFQSEPDRVLWVILENGLWRGFTYEREQQVTGWHRHTPGGTDSAVESWAVIPHPDGDRDQNWAIVARTIGGVTRRYIEVQEPIWVPGTAIEDAFFLDSGLTYDGAPATTITGLHHLAGESIMGLADGVPVGPFTVSATGTVTLSAAASVVHLGYPYTAELVPMRIEGGRNDGTSQGKIKRIDGLVLRLEETGTGLFIGPTLAEAVQEVGISPTTLTTGDTERIPWPGGYEQAGLIAIRHTKPLPCTITALLPTLTVE